MIYDSKALTLTEWSRRQDELIADGYEVIKAEAGVVYVRKPLPDVAYRPARAVNT